MADIEADKGYAEAGARLYAEEEARYEKLAQQRRAAALAEEEENEALREEETRVSIEADDIEIERASDLAQTRFADSIENEEEEGDAVSAAVEGDKPINLPIALFFAAFIFMFFDAPQYLFDFIGWGFLAVVNLIIAFFGWLTIYLWLASNGRSLLDVNKGGWKLFAGSALADMIPLVPGLSGFVITYALRDQISRIAKKVPGASTLAKTAT